MSRWYAAILFASRPEIGCVLALATTFAPDHGFLGLVCGHVAYLTGRLFELPDADMESGLYGANGVLFGLWIGTHIADQRMMIFLCLAGGFLICLLTRAFVNTIGYWLHLPTGSLPFVTAALLCSHSLVAQERLFGVDVLRPTGYSSGFLDRFLAHPVATGPVEVVLREGLLLVGSIGAVLFQRQLVPCIVATVALFASSRMLFLITTGGFLFVRLALGLLPLSAAGFETFVGLNSVLIAISLGGTFLLPGARTFLLMLGAQAVGLVTSLSLAGLARVWGCDFTALPFNLMVAGAFLMLQGRAFGARPFPPGPAFRSPEEALNYYRRWNDRLFHRAMSLPVFGEWQIVQGFDGAETHKGPWRYGMDLAAVDDQRRRFRSTGLVHEDYFAFGAPVRSPVDGVVAAAWDQIDDNPIGSTNLKEPWGNFVLIHSAGVYVGLYHLRRGSLEVVVGQPVVVGTPVGRVGNSGRSSLPHLHVQVQLQPVAGAPSVPFLIRDIVSAEGDGATFHSTTRPIEQAVVREAVLSEEAVAAMAFRMGEQWRMVVETAGARTDETWTFSYSLAGTLLITDGRGEVELHVAARSLEVIRTSGRPLAALDLFALALADLPHERFAGLHWTTRLQGPQARPFLTRSRRALSWIAGEIFSATCLHRLVDDEGASSIEGALCLRVVCGAAVTGDPDGAARLQARFLRGAFLDLVLEGGSTPRLTCRRLSS